MLLIGMLACFVGKCFVYPAFEVCCGNLLFVGSPDYCTGPGLYACSGCLRLSLLHDGRLMHNTRCCSQVYPEAALYTAARHSDTDLAQKHTADTEAVRKMHSGLHTH